MATTLQELINAKDANTVKAELLTLLAKYGFDATDWNSGSEARTLLEIESLTISELWTTVQQIAKGMYLDTAEDGWLTLLAKSQYGIDRTPAEYTRGYATFSLVVGGGPRTITAGNIIVSDGLGHNFITDNPTPVNLTSLSPKGQVEIISQVTGSANNVAQGAINQINQGPSDITVTNSGLLTPAIVFSLPTTSPYTITGLALKYQVTVNGVTSPLITFTFPANYANSTLLAAALNGDLTFSTNLTATPVTANTFSISTKLVGETQGIKVDRTGTANAELGFSTVVDTSSIGGTSIDSSASIFSGSLAGPFNISGTNIILTPTVDGIIGSPQTFTFLSNYGTMDLLVNGLNSLFSAIPGWPLIATNDSNRLKISTIKTGPKQGIKLSATSSVNIPLGFSNLIDTIAVGTSAWIIQEGRDEESDDSLRTRCKARWGILGAGTRDAFLTWAKEADPKVQKVAVYSNYLNGTPKAGAVTVYIAGINTALDPTTVTNVYNYILAKMPIMSDLYVGTVTIVPIFYTGILTITNVVNTPQFLNGYKNNVNSYSQSLNIGDSVLKQRIEAEIISALRPGFLGLTLSQPTSPITSVDKNQMAVILEDPGMPMTIIIK